MRALLLAIALLTGVAVSPGALAQSRPEAGQSARKAPLAQVLAMIARQTPGRHLNTTQGDYQGRSAYFVQWQLPSGKVAIFIVDAESGQIVGRQGG